MRLEARPAARGSNLGRRLVQWTAILVPIVLLGGGLLLRRAVRDEGVPTWSLLAFAGGAVLLFVLPVGITNWRMARRSPAAQGIRFRASYCSLQPVVAPEQAPSAYLQTQDERVLSATRRVFFLAGGDGGGRVVWPPEIGFRSEVQLPIDPSVTVTLGTHGHDVVEITFQSGSKRRTYMASGALPDHLSG